MNNPNIRALSEDEMQKICASLVALRAHFKEWTDLYDSEKKSRAATHRARLLIGLAEAMEEFAAMIWQCRRDCRLAR